MNETVSVIVPVFNVEKYLEECIDSIIGQTYSQLQIVLVDDGSTDRSGVICDRYAEKDRRIRVIHQSNQGVSVARNTALNYVVGKYIVFADSDDILPLTSIMDRVDEISDYDLLACRLKRFYQDGTVKIAKEYSLDEIEKSGYMYELFDERMFPYQGYLPDKLFLAKIIRKNSVLFDEDIKLNEDRLFLLKYLLVCEKVKLSNKVVYQYRQRQDSAIGETAQRVTEGELTVNESFARMKQLTKDSYPDLYYLICRRAFECGMSLQKRVSRADKKTIDYLNRIMWLNARLYISNPQLNWVEKAKIFLHCVIRQ